MPREFSGPQWVDRFPTSRLVSDLAPDFRPRCEDFLGALGAAGAAVNISATLRPPERAYLMFYAFAIHTGEMHPGDVPPHPGVEIDWVHRHGDGTPDEASSRSAADAMVGAYGIVFKPSLTSLHIFGKAIDMSITWPSSLAIAPKNGPPSEIASEPRSGLNHQLWDVGATYGVIKLASDAPHWSINGH